MVSQRMFALGSQPSAIRELFDYGQVQAALVGEDRVFDFSIGNPSVPAPPQVNETILKLLREEPSLAVHGYTSAAGANACREAVAADLNQRFGTAYGKEQLFMTCGAAPALAAVFKALLEDGEQNEFIVSAPYFPEYQVFVEAAGARLVVLPAETEYFQIDFDALEQAINKHTRGVIVNSPNNPCGVVYTEQTLRRLAELLNAKAAELGHPIYLISDEPYREVVFHGQSVPFIPNIYENTIICYSYSKCFSLPGERIGYVLTPPGQQRLYLAICGAARDNGHICAPSLMQRVVTLCATLRPDVTLYERHADFLYQQMTGCGYQAARPDGALYLFFRAPGGLSGQQFSDLARDRYNVLLVPGDSFGCPDWLRLSFCVPTQRIENAMPFIEKLIKEV